MASKIHKRSRVVSRKPSFLSYILDKNEKQKNTKQISYGLLNDSHFTLAPDSSQQPSEFAFKQFLEALSNDPHMGSLKNHLEGLESQEPLPKPTPEAKLRRLEKGFAHSFVSKDAKKWLPQVRHNAKLEQQAFECAFTDLKNTTSSLSAHFTPLGIFEQELHQAIQKSGLENNISKLKTFPEASSLKDAAHYQRLARLRSLLFHQHRKAKRLGKIKSKMWRKVYRKTELQEREKLLNLLEEESPDLAQQIRRQIDEKRAMMRILKHQQSRKKWAEMALRFGGKQMQKVVSLQSQKYTDEKQALDRIIRSRPGKALNPDSTDSDTDEPVDTIRHDAIDSNEFKNPVEQLFQMTKKSIEKSFDPENDPHTTATESNLLNLPFMKRAMEKQKQENERLAREALDHLNRVQEKLHSDQNAYDDDEDGLSQHMIQSDELFKGKKKLPEIPQDLLENARRNRNNKNNQKPFQTLPATPTLTNIQTEVVQPNVTEAITDLVNSIEDNKTLQPTQDQEAFVKEAFVLTSTNVKEFEEHIIEMEHQDNDKKNNPSNKKFLPGWGSWTGEGIITRRHKQPVLKKEALPKNTLKGRIYINRRHDLKLARYLVKSVPYPYSTEQQFKLSHRHPLGPEWNTLQVHERLIEPQVHVRPGTIITPLQYAKHCSGDVLDSLLDAWSEQGLKKKVPKVRL